MRVYFDNAATSFPKPEAVYNAVDHYQRQIGVAVGRASYRDAIETQRIVDQCRQKAALYFGCSDPRRIIFTFSGTDGLNLTLAGLCRRGDHVITSALEHNSVLRPLRHLQETLGIDVTTISPGSNGRLEPVDVRSALRPNTKFISIIHASNVTGIVQPIAEIGEIARSAGVLVIVDAAQSAGHLPIDVSQNPVDLIVCPGHKGLLGPLGTGLVYIRPGIEEHLECYRFGGTGTHSDDERQPTAMPERYESGNHNVPGLVGLEAGIDFILQESKVSKREREIELTQRLVDGFRSCPHVVVYGHDSDPTNSVGVVSINIDDFSPQECASILDDSFGIQVRAGLHCAPGVHRWLGTLTVGGTVRFSIGHMTTPDEIDYAIESIRKLTSI